MQQHEMPTWAVVKDAHKLFNRPSSTIYRWIKSGDVRTSRPMHEMWAYVPDLIKMDGKTPRRRQKPKPKVTAGEEVSR